MIRKHVYVCLFMCRGSEAVQNIYCINKIPDNLNFLQWILVFVS